MKKLFVKTFVYLFNKFFKTKIDSATFSLLRNTQVPSSDLNRFIDINRRGDIDILYRFYHEFYNSSYSQQTPFSSSIAGKGSLASYLNIVLDVKKSTISIDDINNLKEGRLVFSQEGEDALLSRIFTDKKEGFFVDIGAHHPKRFSNTFLFYQLGWRGINVEPNLDVKRLFDTIRPLDINLGIAIGNDESESIFYMFEEPALNTFSREIAEQYEKSGQILIDKKTIKTRRLSSVLDEYASSHAIDLMSIDVEGFEMPVLQSNNWDKYRPQILLVEILNFDINRATDFPVHNLLLTKGYWMWAKTYNTIFYKDNIANR